MPQVPTPPSPGSLTVSPLAGWQSIAVLLVLAAVVAVGAVAAVLLADGTGQSERSEWQAWLDGRSASSGSGGAAADQPAGTEPGPGSDRRSPAPVDDDGAREPAGSPRVLL